MKELRNWGDLSEFGIERLTGEACTLGYRGLCDVTRRGANIVRDLLGAIQLDLPNNWNSGSVSDPHVGSIMLPHEMFAPLALWCLLSQSKFAEVWIMTNGTVRGMTDDDLRLESEIGYWEQHADQIQRKFQNETNNPVRRNVHAFTGRLV